MKKEKKYVLFICGFCDDPHFFMFIHNNNAFFYFWFYFITHTCGDGYFTSLHIYIHSPHVHKSIKLNYKMLLYVLLLHTTFYNFPFIVLFIEICIVIENRFLYLSIFMYIMCNVRTYVRVYEGGSSEFEFEFGICNWKVTKWKC